MNLGLDNLRELLEGFLSNSGGRRGRERENRRQEAAGEAETAEPAETAGDTGSVPAESESTEDASTTATADTDERPNAEDVGDEEVVDDLYHRINSLEEELDSKGSRLGTIQDSQEQVAEQVEEVNDTVRQLLGIYDQLTNDVNPFTGEGEGEGGFGVFGEENEGDGFGLEKEATTDGGAETVSFADLKDVIEDAAEAEAREASAETIEFDESTITESEDEGVDDTRVEVQATESVDDPADGTEEDEAEADGDDVTLDALANTYATDVIVFEWLTELVRTAGPAATLRAISYYHEIGWIEEDVKKQLESVLSGPDLDIHVDPGQTPDELTAEDHADSYTYIMKLNAIHETKRETEV